MIVVTGGSGFIGSYVCRLLEEKGYKARIIDLVPPPIGVNAEFVRASVLDPLRLQKLFEGAEGVIHLAALIDVQSSIADPFSDFQVNAQGTLNVLEAARRAKVRSVAYASSAAVYGNTEDVPVEESQPAVPLSPYGASKLTGERYVLLYNSIYGMQNAALRLFNVYGVGQKGSSPYSGVITKFASAIRDGRQPTVFGDGRQTRDFVHADDVAGAFLAALFAGGSQVPINIGGGKEISIVSLLERMYQIAGKMPEIRFAPAKEGEIRRSCAGISLARRRLGFAPKVSFDSGLAEILRGEPSNARQPSL